MRTARFLAVLVTVFSLHISSVSAQELDDLPEDLKQQVIEANKIREANKLRRKAQESKVTTNSEEPKEIVYLNKGSEETEQLLEACRAWVIEGPQNARPAMEAIGCYNYMNGIIEALHMDTIERSERNEPSGTYCFDRWPLNARGLAPIFIKYVEENDGMKHKKRAYVLHQILRDHAKCTTPENP